MSEHKNLAALRESCQSALDILGPFDQDLMSQLASTGVAEVLLLAEAQREMKVLLDIIAVQRKALDWMKAELESDAAKKTCEEDWHGTDIEGWRGVIETYVPDALAKADELAEKLSCE